MIRGLRNERLSPMVVSDVRLGISIHWRITSSLLLMINSAELLSAKLKAFEPNWMDVNSGKSTNQSHFNSFTLKNNTRTVIECTATKQKWFQTGQVYSSFQYINITLQFQRRNILNLNRWIIREGITTNLQFLQVRTILQIEMTSRIITPAILVLCETIHSNDHSLQLR